MSALLATFDPQGLSEITLLSLWVSGLALLLSSLIGVPLGAYVGLQRFVGRGLLITLLYTGMALPPVVVGLFVYLLLSRAGPLGRLDFAWIPALYTPAAMITAQIILALPQVAGFTLLAIVGLDPNLRVQLRALGATQSQITWTLLREARSGVIASIVAGFGAILSEVGAVMMVGGNIQHSTRVLTTAIVLETSKGRFAQAIALGLLLLSISFVCNLVLLRLQGRRIEA